MNAVELSLVNQRMPIAKAPVFAEQGGDRRLGRELFNSLRTEKTLADRALGSVSITSTRKPSEA